jgi:uncharacterized membrane protein
MPDAMIHYEYTLCEIPKLMSAFCPPGKYLLLSNRMPDQPTNRVEVIDVVRGLVMVLMTLDHTRDYFGNHDIDALDVSATTPALFFSRWITHLCAPAFVFLAGSSVSMLSRKLDSGHLTNFLIGRGLILIVFEQTLLRCFGWYFNFDYHYMSANVLFGIGGSLILLNLFTRFPERFQLPFSLLVILLPTFLTVVPYFTTHATGAFWQIVLLGGNIEFLPGYNFYVSYPLIPWFGIMSLGYSLAGQFLQSQNSAIWIYWSLSFLVLFIVMRFIGLGNPVAWQQHEITWRSVIDFINLEKYPPSLLFTLLTLSIAFLMFGLLSSVTGSAAKFFGILGKAPLFYYATHITLIHLTALVVALIRYGHAEWLYVGPGIFWDVTLPGHPVDYGLPLPVVYGITVLVVSSLYQACRWYSVLKGSNYNTWLKYF